LRIRQKICMLQFSTGWNSTLKQSIEKTGELMFQFPMGWNSTLEGASSSGQRRVSIPNGMELY